MIDYQYYQLDRTYKRGKKILALNLRVFSGSAI
jgi:hypothetical protein